MAEERSTVEILKAARERISDPERWIKGRLSDTLAYCGDERWDDIARLQEGTCWCASGAIGAEAASPEGWEECCHAFKAANGGIASVNDRSSHPQILAAFDRAIELAEADVG